MIKRKRRIRLTNVSKTSLLSSQLRQNSVPQYLQNTQYKNQSIKYIVYKITINLKIFFHLNKFIFFKLTFRMCFLQL